MRRYLLWPFSLLYGLAVVIRNKLFDWGIFQSTEFDLPVICVGNLSTGGTGKTPQIEYLVELLKHDYKVATLSRGYGGSNNYYTLVDETSKASEIGDEPLQIKLKHPDITVAIDPDRTQGIRLLRENIKPEVVLLDDAFQHRKVRAGLSILITPYSSPFYEDALLPAGNLREPITGKERADVIIVSKCPPDISDSERQSIIERIKPSVNQQVFFTYIDYAVPMSIDGVNHLELNENTSIVLVTGIGNPVPLVEHVNVRYSLKEHVKFPDHYSFSESDIQHIQQKFSIIASTDKAILTTEKDAARLRSTNLMNLPVFYLPIEVRFIGHGEEERFNNLIKKYVAGNKGNS